MKTSPPESLLAEARRGARLTQALVLLAAEHAREHGLSTAVVVGALATSLGYVAAGVAQAKGYDLAAYEGVILRHVARILQDESARPAFH